MIMKGKNSLAFFLIRANIKIGLATDSHIENLWLFYLEAALKKRKHDKHCS